MMLVIRNIAKYDARLRGGRLQLRRAHANAVAAGGPAWSPPGKDAQQCKNLEPAFDPIDRL
jgi:hypothetical protein